MYYRVRTIHPDGSISVRDLAFSQIVAMLKGASRTQRDEFWERKAELVLPSGASMWFVKEV